MRSPITYQKLCWKVVVLLVLTMAVSQHKTVSRREAGRAGRWEGRQEGCRCPEERVEEA